MHILNYILLSVEHPMLPASVLYDFLQFSVVCAVDEIALAELLNISLPQAGKMFIKLSIEIFPISFPQ